MAGFSQMLDDASGLEDRDSFTAAMGNIAKQKDKHEEQSKGNAEPELDLTEAEARLRKGSIEGIKTGTPLSQLMMRKLNHEERKEYEALDKSHKAKQE